MNAHPEALGHALNNLLCKIIGSAELALERVSDNDARFELSAIIELSEEGAELVKSLFQPTSPDL